ncbi:MAG TPA: type II secretion system F family protein [Acidimicrobiales bacterium]|nr:type II secretion system F family protein [Acidimicrobiales bacterium]
MTRLAVGAGLVVWIGATMLLSTWSRLTRPSLAERLRPFHPGGASVHRRPAPGSVASLGEVLVPVVRQAGDRLASILGVAEGAERRLERVHAPMSAGVFRLRQAAASAGAAIAGALLGLSAGAPPGMSALLTFGTPALVFLLFEQRLARRSEEWQRITAEEIPVVAEQLAMLLNAGFSLGASIGRLASRGQGCVARDLEAVVNRVHQGLTEAAALKEWSDRVRVEGVTRLVGVLTLHSEAADLGRLVSAEARSARRDLQRRTVEQIERRAQQVWVPVTVATLVPGAILLAVPFLAALHMFANG